MTDSLESVSARFAYDDVPYDTEANADTHPSTMATLARLCGLAAAPARTARVLEIGCGNGANLIAAATYLPEARFVGFDLAASAVSAGIESARASGTSNVDLFAADIRDVRARGLADREPGGFDYVVAHGMLSWVPEPVREDLLATMRDALAPAGIGFVSVNALPGWELRRALRELALDATRELDDPGEKVAVARRRIAEIAQDGRDAAGFFGVLAAAAREYDEHVTRATPPEAPFSRYLFHDLLAAENEPFSVDDLSHRLARAGLRIVCETPLRPARAGTFTSLAADLAVTGTPFLQVLVQRDDAPRATAPEPARVAELDLWADLTPVSVGTFRTSTGALVRPTGADGLIRAARCAPGFVAVRDLADDEITRNKVARQLWEGFCEGVFTLLAERPRVAPDAGERPRVAPYVRLASRTAVARGAASAVLTNAIHRSFRAPRAELEVVHLMDGERTRAQIASEVIAAARTPPEHDVQRFVDVVVDRFARHLFVLPEAIR
ncbi:MAG: Methyltransferase type 12 [Labilithrix sp.]|nr:Methyltransferase type 12 [Labilithrix sp.]